MFEGCFKLKGSLFRVFRVLETFFFCGRALINRCFWLPGQKPPESRGARLGFRALGVSVSEAYVLACSSFDFGGLGFRALPLSSGFGVLDADEDLRLCYFLVEGCHLNHCEP